MSAAGNFAIEVGRHVDTLLDLIEQSRRKNGLTERQAADALEAATYTDIAEYYENWLDDGDPAELDGSRSL